MKAFSKFYIKSALYLAVAVGFSPASAGSYEDFFIAVNRDDRETVAELLQRGFDPNTVDPKGRLALSFAIQNESKRVLRTLIDAPGLDVNALNAVGESALMMAAIKGDLDWCKRLVAKGARVNQSGWTALHYAASGPNPEVVAWLIQQGADVEAPSPNGTTPLMMAARYGGETSVEHLLAARAQLAKKNQQGLGAVEFARLDGRDALADRLARLR